MSKYLAFTGTTFKDQAMLVGALEDIGCRDVRQGTDLKMGVYYAEQRAQKQTANVIVPRNTVGNHYGDIGFVESEQGLAPVMDELDQRCALKGHFIARLRAAYNERAVKKIAERVRGTIQRTVSGGVTKIKVRF